MKISMIYLAAGNSRRFGRNKLLELLEGRPLFLHGLEALGRAAEMLQADRSVETEILVVSQYPEILAEAAHRPQGLKTVESPDSVQGLSVSIRRGIQNAEGDYYLFQAADQPFLKPETICHLVQSTLASGKAIGVLRCRNQNRNPVLFHSSLREELLGLSGDQGGRVLLKKDPARVWSCEVEEPEQFRDIDILEDFSEAEERLRGNGGLPSE
ncbi:MAG: nucleotidyltransferase family protein [Candidatus Limivivens sp.]|nr:nucleotidyltransferase family protein [Candidatus Limivivens sp.]